MIWQKNNTMSAKMTSLNDLAKKTKLTIFSIQCFIISCKKKSTRKKRLNIPVIKNLNIKVLNVRVQFGMVSI